MTVVLLIATAIATALLIFFPDRKLGWIVHMCVHNVHKAGNSLHVLGFHLGGLGGHHPLGGRLIM